MFGDNANDEIIYGIIVHSIGKAFIIIAKMNPYSATISGHALCVVELVDIVPFEEGHMAPACLDGYGVPEGCFAWKLANLRWIEPFPNKGRLGLYDVADEKISMLPVADVLSPEAFERAYAPLVHWGRREPCELI